MEFRQNLTDDYLKSIYSSEQNMLKIGFGSFNRKIFNTMTTSIIIPARFGSSRYRGKPLVKILGKEMVIRVADICNKIKNVKVFVATDSKKIANVVKKYGYDYIFTSSNCLTGTDRVAEASKDKIKNLYKCTGR